MFKNDDGFGFPLDEQWMYSSWRQFLPARGTLSSACIRSEHTFYAFFTEHMATCRRHHLPTTRLHFSEWIHTNGTLSSRCRIDPAATRLGTAHCRLLWLYSEGDFERWGWEVIVVGHAGVTNEIRRSQVLLGPCHRSSRRSVGDGDRAAAVVEICQIDKVVVITRQINNLLLDAVRNGLWLTSPTTGFWQMMPRPCRHHHKVSTCNAAQKQISHSAMSVLYTII